MKKNKKPTAIRWAVTIIARSAAGKEPLVPGSTKHRCKGCNRLVYVSPETMKSSKEIIDQQNALHRADPQNPEAYIDFHCTTCAGKGKMKKNPQVAPMSAGQLAEINSAQQAAANPQP